MISQLTLDRMVRAIHAQPELAGCVIGFQGNLMSRVLHPGYSATKNSARVIVVIEEYETRDPAVLQNNQFWSRIQSGSPENAPNRRWCACGVQGW